MPDGLFHLGSLAVLVGLVYLNLEKISSNRNDLIIDLKQLRDEIRERIIRVDIPVTYIDKKTGKKKINLIYDNRHMHFLLCIAKMKERKEYGLPIRSWYFAYRNVRAFGLPFIVDGWHTIPAGILTLMSACAFLAEVGMQVFKNSLSWLNIFPAWLFFTLYAGTSIFMVLCAFMSHRLDGLRVLCERFLDEWDAEKEHMDELSLTTTRTEVEKFIQSVQKPVNPDAKPKSNDLTPKA